jgi:hypothetical protein
MIAARLSNLEPGRASMALRRLAREFKAYPATQRN